MLLGETVVKTAVNRMDLTVLTPEESDSIDRAWKQLSRSWRAEEVARRKIITKLANNKTPEAVTAVGGSYMTLMVDAEGLEPPTSGL